MKPAPINATERNLHHVFAAAMLRDNTLGLKQRRKAIDAMNSVSTPKIVHETLSNGAELSAHLAQSVPQRTNPPSATSRKSP